MSDRRVGSLDNASYYGCRSLAVYQNGTGFYFKLDGTREKVHGNQRWTTSAGVQMRGAHQIAYESMDDASDWESASSNSDAEEQQIRLAIEASLMDTNPAPIPEAIPPSPDAAPNVPAPAPAPEVAAAGPTCAICLDAPATMLMRPCRHLNSCQACSPSLVRRPCAICRTPVTSVERVFLN